MANGASGADIQRSTASPLVYVLVVALFFASGLSSLIYQVVWTRMLGLVFGSTTYATATVLSIFMGGLCLGAWLAGRYADRVRNQLFWYGALEALIGLWALLVPSLFAAATYLYPIICSTCHNNVILFGLCRFALAAAILLPPTTCMGASLPLLSSYVTNKLDEAGQRIGTLYSVNTFGAIGGAALAGFVLLPLCGLQTSTVIAAGVNFVLFLTVIPAALNGTALKAGVSNVWRLSPRVQKSAALPVPKRIKMAMVCFAMSGGIAMIYEVCWTRALLVMVGSSTYAFTIMLCSFLTGIFLGSLICSRFVDRIKEPFLLFSALQLAIAALAALAMYEFIYLPYWNILLYSLCPSNGSWYMACKFMLSAAILIPFTLCIGATFPAIVKASTQDLAQIGRSTGDIYAANTSGAIIGAFVAGFVLIPLFGVNGSLDGAVSASAIVSALSLWCCDWSTSKRKAIYCATICTVSVLWLCVPRLWDPLVMVYGQVYRRHVAEDHIPKSFGELVESMRRRCHVIFYRDGACSSVGVLEFGSPQHPLRSLITNGNVDGSDTGDTPTQSLVAAFPLLLKPNAADVAVIGWGVGMSVGTATLFPVASIDAVELEPAVVESSTLFHHVNHSPEQSPKVHIQYNDGRNYLLATDKKFDVIVSEPSNPWQSGVCNLFTREYFQVCRKRLKPGGVLSLWIQLAEVSPENVRSILKSLTESFPQTIVLALNGSNIAVLASDSPLQLDPDKLKDVLKIDAIKNELSNFDLDSPEAIITRLLVSNGGVRKLVHAVKANTDDSNLLEFSVGRSYETQNFRAQNGELIPESASRPWEHVDLQNRSNVEQAREAMLIARKSVGNNTYGATRWLEHSIDLYPAIQTTELARYMKMPRSTFALIEKRSTEILIGQPNNWDMLKARGLARLALGDISSARSDFEKALQFEPENKLIQLYIGETYYADDLTVANQSSDTTQEADFKPRSRAMMLKYFMPLLNDKKFARKHPDVFLWAADAYYGLGDSKHALTLMTEYRDIAPESAIGCRLLGLICSDLGRRLEGAAYLERSFQLGAEESGDIRASLADQASTDDRLRMYKSVLKIDPLNEACAAELRQMQDTRAHQLLEQVHMQ